MKHVLILFTIFIASCSSIDIVDDAVTKYCSLSEAQRMANREAISSVVFPNSIEITCEQTTDTESL